jgi:hypothetical protein
MLHTRQAQLRGKSRGHTESPRGVQELLLCVADSRRSAWGAHQAWSERTLPSAVSGGSTPTTVGCPKPNMQPCEHSTMQTFKQSNRQVPKHSRTQALNHPNTCRFATTLGGEGDWDYKIRLSDEVIFKI